MLQGPCILYSYADMSARNTNYAHIVEQHGVKQLHNDKSVYLCTWLSIQVHASSLQKAKNIVDVLPEVDTILVGGKKYEPVQQPDIESAFMLTNKNPEMEEAVFRGVGGIFVLYQNMATKALCIELVNTVLLWIKMRRNMS